MNKQVDSQTSKKIIYVDVYITLLPEVAQFLCGVNWFVLLVANPRPKNLVFPIIYPELEWEQVDSCFSWGH